MIRLAHGFVEALRAQPLALALVLVNLMFLLGGTYIIADAVAAARGREARATERLDKLINECLLLPRGAPQ